MTLTEEMKAPRRNDGEILNRADFGGDEFEERASNKDISKIEGLIVQIEDVEIVQVEDGVEPVIEKVTIGEEPTDS
jgi:hypothetical protein